jgi:hypothetical protein
VDFILQNPRIPLHLKAAIEVKGCWNRDLKTSMQTQLIDKYLQGPDCQHGIYLVGWFHPKNWDDTDYRKEDAPAWTIQQTDHTISSVSKPLSTRQGTA